MSLRPKCHPEAEVEVHRGYHDESLVQYAKNYCTQCHKPCEVIEEEKEKGE